MVHSLDRYCHNLAAQCILLYGLCEMEVILLGRDEVVSWYRMSTTEASDCPELHGIDLTRPSLLMFAPDLFRLRPAR